MWVKPSRKPERGDHVDAEFPAGLQTGVVQVAQGQGDRADPLVHLGDQGARVVLADVLEQDLPVRADGVVGELLAVDELLDADRRDVPDHGQHRVELGGVFDPVGVGRTRAVDRLDDERVADAFGGGPHVGHGPGLRVPRGAQPGRVEQLLHPLLVPERDGLRHGQPGQPELLAQPRGEQHVRLPQALDRVHRGAPGQLADHGGHVVVGGQRADVDVVGERVPGHRGQRVGGLVAQADHAGPARASPRVKNAISAG